ncbi:hypothetical protein KXX34_005143 [Aspergillus fumigatus]|nr:hypothetical protein KXX34_005143 [Aspergillus fumigatus]
MVKTLPFGDIQVPSPGFGAMGLSFGLGTNLTFEEAEPVLLKAIELGCTFWDTAVVYQAGVNEKLLGDFIRKHNVRDKVFIASKCGFNVFGDRSVTNSPAHIKEYIEGTIERLGFAPDLYYLHRIDPKTPLEESIPALDEIRKAGKTKYIGLSECSAATLRKANSIAKIDAVQAEYSAFETIHETDGLIDTCRELGVAYVAYSPLGHGWLVDDFQYKSPDDFAPNDFRRTSPKFQGENFYKNRAIVEEIKKLAARKKCTTSQIALAWVAAQGFIAIPGTTKAKRLEENWASREIELTEEEKQEMRRIIDVAKPHGNSPIFGEELAQTVDVSDRSAVKAALIEAQHHLGPINAIANFAGTGGHQLGVEPIWETSNEEFEFITNLNIRGLFNILGEALTPGFLGELQSIVHIASMFGTRGYKNGAVFAASKHAAVGMVKSAALEVGSRGHPSELHSTVGPIDTPMFHQVRENAGLSSSASDTPIPRPGQPEEVASIAVFLLGDQSSYVTGAVWNVDGGANA